MGDASGPQIIGRRDHCEEPKFVENESGPTFRRASLPQVQLCVELVYRLRDGTPEVKITDLMLER